MNGMSGSLASAEASTTAAMIPPTLASGLLGGVPTVNAPQTHCRAAAPTHRRQRRAALADVGVREHLNQPGAAQPGEVHILLRAARHRFALFLTDIHDAPNAAVLAIDPLGVRVGVLVTWISVIPIHDPDRAVGAGQ